jgi:alpha-L-rhamnosidase
MPHPRGDLRVSLQVEGAILRAEITLPEGVTGSFVWAGKTVALRAGQQTLRLP